MSLRESSLSFTLWHGNTLAPCNCRDSQECHARMLLVTPLALLPNNKEVAAAAPPAAADSDVELHIAVGAVVAKAVATVGEPEPAL